MKSISVWYNKDHNGCHLTDDDNHSDDEELILEAESDIMDWAGEFCTDSGEFYGNIDELKSVIKDTINATFNQLYTNIKIEIG